MEIFRNCHPQHHHSTDAGADFQAPFSILHLHPDILRFIRCILGNTFLDSSFLRSCSTLWLKRFRIIHPQALNAYVNFLIAGKSKKEIALILRNVDPIYTPVALKATPMFHANKGKLQAIINVFPNIISCDCNDGDLFTDISKLLINLDVLKLTCEFIQQELSRTALPSSIKTLVMKENSIDNYASPKQNLSLCFKDLFSYCINLDTLTLVFSRASRLIFPAEPSTTIESTLKSLLISSKNCTHGIMNGICKNFKSLVSIGIIANFIQDVDEKGHIFSQLSTLINLENLLIIIVLPRIGEDKYKKMFKALAESKPLRFYINWELWNGIEEFDTLTPLFLHLKELFVICQSASQESRILNLKPNLQSQYPGLKINFLYIDSYYEITADFSSLKSSA